MKSEERMKMRDDAIEVEISGDRRTGAAAATLPLAPMLTCIAAGLALAFTPVFVWRMTTGTWVCHAAT